MLIRAADEASIASLLRSSAVASRGRLAHHRLVADLHHGYGPPGTFLSNLLIQMYGKTRRLEDARSVFDHMDALSRNVYTWTLMIAAYAHHPGRGSRHSREALELYQNMVCQGVRPDNVTHLSVVAVCSDPAHLRIGILVHQTCLAMQQGGAERQQKTGESQFEHSDEVLANAFLHMYTQCGSLEYAKNMIFGDNGSCGSVIAWNSMIGGYVEHSQFMNALILYYGMLQEVIIPDKVTFIGILGALTGLAILAEGKQIHCMIINSGFDSDVILATSLIKFYEKCSCVDRARDVFDRMQKRDVIVWNSMLAVYVTNLKRNQAFELYQNMKDEGVEPNEITFVTILGACTSLEHLLQGKVIHSDLEKLGFESNVIVGTALVNMYGKCEQLTDARKAFYKLKERNVVSWTALIEVHATHGEESRALEFYKDMTADGVIPNAVTIVSIISACTKLIDVEQGREIHTSIKYHGLEKDVLVGIALVQMYGKFGDVENARKVFDEIHPQNIVSWTAMCTIYVEHGYPMEAVCLYQQMCCKDVKPDNYLFISILEACSCLAFLKQGEEVHSRMSGSVLESDVAVGTALINMYGKCGDLQKAWDALQKINDRNVLSWTALISVYFHAGYAEEALLFFEQMLNDKVRPDGVTFLSILSGCSHAGLVAEGVYHFLSMSRNHRIIPTLDHHACMIDLIGRAGNLENVLKFIREMPFIPDAVTWCTLLGACRLHDDVEHGKWAAKKIMQLDPERITPYVLLSNLCATERGHESAYCGV